jgi:hypothetical protein
MRLRTLAHSRAVLVLGVAIALVVPVITLPRLPHVSPWPLLLGLVPWIIGKYVLCPLRWRALTNADLSRRWHIRAYAESELLGLLTPGHVGSDVWRMHRLTRSGLARGDALTSVGMDRMVGAIGLTAFVAFAGVSLPPEMLLVAVGVGGVALAGAVLVRFVRPDLLPSGPMPSAGKLAQGMLLSAVYQATIVCLLLGAVAATGHTLSPIELLGAFGASQLAGAVPGPNGASPRDGALVVALVSLGLPWVAATAAVALKATLAWLPALAIGGVSLVFTRRAAARLAHRSLQTSATGRP